MAMTHDKATGKRMKHCVCLGGESKRRIGTKHSGKAVDFDCAKFVKVAASLRGEDLLHVNALEPFKLGTISRCKSGGMKIKVNTQKVRENESQNRAMTE